MALRKMLTMVLQVAPVKSPEDTDEYLETLKREKTMVEILLRKYGFGSWTRPDEVECLVL
jgi:hypothetical protein